MTNTNMVSNKPIKPSTNSNNVNVKHAANEIKVANEKNSLNTKLNDSKKTNTITAECPSPLTKTLGETTFVAVSVPCVALPLQNITSALQTNFDNKLVNNSTFLNSDPAFKNNLKNNLKNNPLVQLSKSCYKKGTLTANLYASGLKSLNYNLHKNFKSPETTSGNFENTASMAFCDALTGYPSTIAAITQQHKRAIFTLENLVPLPNTFLEKINIALNPHIFMLRFGKGASHFAGLNATREVFNSPDLPSYYLLFPSFISAAFTHPIETIIQNTICWGETKDGNIKFPSTFKMLKIMSNQNKNILKQLYKGYIPAACNSLIINGSITVALGICENVLPRAITFFGKNSASQKAPRQEPITKNSTAYFAQRLY